MAKKLKDETTEYNAKFIVASDDLCYPRYFTTHTGAVKCAKVWKSNCPNLTIFVRNKENGELEYINSNS